MTAKDVVRDLASGFVLRSEEEVVENCIGAIAHRNGLGHVLKAGHSFQTFAKRSGDNLVRPFQHLLFSEESRLRTGSTGIAAPGFIAQNALIRLRSAGSTNSGLVQNALRFMSMIGKLRKRS